MFEKIILGSGFSCVDLYCAAGAAAVNCFGM